MAQIGTIGLETQNNGTVQVPVFDTADAGSDVHTMWRVQTASGTGFIPLVDPTDAAFPYLRVQSQNHGVVAVHKEASLIKPMVISADAGGPVYANLLSDGSQTSFSPLTAGNDNTYGASISKNYIAYANYDNNVYVHNRSDGSQVSWSPITSFAGSDMRDVDITDNYLALGGTGDDIHVHSMSDGSELSWSPPTGLSGVEDTSVTDNYVAWASGDSAFLRNISDGSSVSVSLSNTNCTAVGLTNDYIAEGGGSTEDIRVYNLPGGGEVSWSGINTNFFEYTISISGTHIAYGGDGSAFYVHNLSDGSELSWSPVDTGDSNINTSALSDTYAVNGAATTVNVRYLSDGSQVSWGPLNQSQYTVRGADIME